MKNWKVALCIGGTLAALPLLAGVIMFQIPFQDPLTRAIFPFFGIGLPGMLMESLIMSAREPHGGGTPVEMLLIVFPLNAAFYAGIMYFPVKIIAGTMRNRRVGDK